MLRPTETDMDRLLEYIWTGASAAPPVLESLRLCARRGNWDFSLLRGDQLVALDAVAFLGSRFRAADVPRVHLVRISPPLPLR